MNMTNKINIIFDNSDLHIQENLVPNNIKIFFGTNDETPSLPCENYWSEIDGNIIDLDCTCSENWNEVDGDQVDLNIDCNDDNTCDNKWKPTEIGDSIDFNCDCIKLWNESSTDFNIDCNTKETPDLGRFRVDSGESVKFEINGLEIFNASTGEFISSELTENKTILDTIYSNSGEMLESQLYRDRIIDLSVKDGSNLSVDVKFSTVENFKPKAETGEVVDILLSTQDTLDIIVNSEDQKLGVELKTYPSATFEINAYDGNNLVVNNLTTSVIFNSHAGVGEDVSFEIFKPYNPNIETDIEIGELVDTVINNDSVLYPFIQHGEYSDSGLSVSYSLQPITFNIGEAVNVIMYESKNHTFDVKYDIGEKINDFRLSTETGFSIEVFDGNALYSNIEYDPYTGFPMQVDAGESLGVELYRNRVVYPDNIDIGESVEISISDHPYMKLSSNIDIGERSEFKLFSDVRLGIFKSEHGENLSLTRLDELENYNAHSGESSSFEMSTAIALTHETINQGENIYTNLKRGEPVYFSFTASAGEALSAEVKTLRSYSLSVKFSIGERVYPNDWVNEPFLIDLDRRKCCDIMLGDLRNVEMDLAPYNHTTYDQTFEMCELLTFDLSCRRALNFSANSGESSAYNNELNTLSFDVLDGSQSVVSNFRTINTTELEDGNQTPENPVIDINRPEIPDDLEYIMSSTGENASAALSATYTIKYNDNFISGEYLTWDLLTAPPFRFNTYIGERTDAVLNTDMTIPAEIPTGEKIRIELSIQVPGFDISTGETASFDIETKSDYYAEFVTEGCLNNDYQDIDPESGQPIPQEYNGTSLEGEMFSKYIVGRCF